MSELSESSHDQPDQAYNQVGPFTRIVAYLIGKGSLDPSAMPEPSDFNVGLPPKLLELWAEEDRRKGILPPDAPQ